MKKYLKSLAALTVVILILIPRLALLGNGLDAQRIWDTNTPAAFRLLQAVQTHTVGAFFAADEKYPLLGSYLYLPVIGAYYEVEHVRGIFATPNDFARAYALGQTNLFFWIRVEMLVINLAALWLLYVVVKKWSNNSFWTGITAIALAAVNFYVTMFSVTPRIHNFAFATTTLVLYTSFLLLEKKHWRNYLLAFGSAAVAASISQSSFTTFVLPILASLYQWEKKKWQWWPVPKELWWSLAGSAVATIVLGYPRAMVALFDHSITLSTVFLSNEHSTPHFGLQYIFSFAFNYFIFTEVVLTWLMVCGIQYVWRRKKNTRTLEPYDVLAAAHIAAFFLMFGFSDVLVGRFTLVIMPSVFLLLARVFTQLAKNQVAFFVALALVVFQACGIGILTQIALAQDTWTLVADKVIVDTYANDRILTTISPSLLGVVPRPESVATGDVGEVGATDLLIAKDNLVGPKSRKLELWNPQSPGISDADLSRYRYVIVGADDPYRFFAEDRLSQNHFVIAKKFVNTRVAEAASTDFLAWDMIVPQPHVPLPLALLRYRSFGPTILLYQHR